MAHPVSLHAQSPAMHTPREPEASNFREFRHQGNWRKSTDISWTLLRIFIHFSSFFSIWFMNYHGFSRIFMDFPGSSWIFQDLRRIFKQYHSSTTRSQHVSFGITQCLNMLCHPSWWRETIGKPLPFTMRTISLQAFSRWPPFPNPNG